MQSKVCELLYEPFDPEVEMRVALRQGAREIAQRLAKSQRDGPERIGYRLWLIERLEACKAGGEYFWRDVVISVHNTMKREAKA